MSYYLLLLEQNTALKILTSVTVVPLVQRICSRFLKTARARGINGVNFQEKHNR